MTIPRSIQEIPRRVADMVRELIPRHVYVMSHEEIELAAHLRGNEALLKALVGLVQARIAGRASVPEPSDPLMCKSMLARDRELQWLLGRLEYVYRSPVNTPAQRDGEPSV